MLVNGLIMKGTVCPYREDCAMKYTACNGNGCPFVEEGGTAEVDFSCGAARFFKMFKKYDKKEDNE